MPSWPGTSAPGLADMAVNGEVRGDAVLRYRPATVNDVPLLARLNRELIDDEGHRNPMSVSQLEARMRKWLEWEYRIALFEREGRVVAYVLYRPQGGDIFLRHLYVVRDARRQGIATAVMRTLARDVWPSNARIALDVLVGSSGALAFYHTLGFQPFSLSRRNDRHILGQQPAPSSRKRVGRQHDGLSHFGTDRVAHRQVQRVARRPPALCARVARAGLCSSRGTRFLQGC